MVERRNEQTVDMDSLMESASVKEPKRSFRGKLNAFILGVVGVAAFTSILAVPVGLAASAGGNVAIDYWDGLENELIKDEIRLPQKTTLLASDGKPFAQFYSENRVSIPLKEMNADFLNALVATEDSRFYETNGYDLVGLGRSAASTFSGSEKQGASGISQQLVKNILILNAKTPEEMAEVRNRVASTKVQELKYAIHLNEKYSKDELLEMYANTIYFGKRAYGIKAASWAYFSKANPTDLTLTEAAVLAGVINNPTLFDPIEKPDSAFKRKNTVLWRMLQEGNITQDQYDKEIKVPVKTNPGRAANGCGTSKYPFYCETVRQELLNDEAYGKTREERENFLYQGGLTITTAMDRKAMDAVDSTLEKAWGNDNRVASAVSIIEPGTGHIVGISQNRDWGSGEGQTEVVYASSERQTGSSFKPFTLATAFELGVDAGSYVLNSDSYYKPQGWDYPRPRGFTNFGFFDYGNVTGADATRQSLNVWFVRMMQQTGVIPVAEMANRLGLTIPISKDTDSSETPVHRKSLSLTLGAWNASPVQMSNAYSVFASGGTKCKPTTIIAAKWSDTGEKIKVTDPKCHQAIMPNVANQMNKVMQEPLNKGGTLSAYNLEGGRVAAGKTGTSNNKGDAWVVGYTPQYAVAVWSGDPRGSSNTLASYTQFGQFRGGSMVGTGGPTSGPIWKPVMDALHEGLPKKAFPAPSKEVGSAIKSTAIPDVTGLEVNHAITTLQSYGYEVRIEEKTEGDMRIEPNTVIKQTPIGGTNGSFGQEVSLTLSEGSDTSIEISDPKRGE